MTEERIAKIIAASGICSRRDAEKLITQGEVTYYGKVIDNPALKFPSTKGILVQGRTLEKPVSKLWIYHKPVGLIVSHNDEQGRETVFDYVPIKERVISIGRLDKNTSGLLLLTNDGNLARQLELPQNHFQRVYRVRVYGYMNFHKIKEALSKPITIDKVNYKPVKIELENSSYNNHWLKLRLEEGKNREIRKILQYFDLKISKLTRIQYGPFTLRELKTNEVREIKNWNLSSYF